MSRKRWEGSSQSGIQGKHSPTRPSKAATSQATQPVTRSTAACEWREAQLKHSLQGPSRQAQHWYTTQQYIVPATPWHQPPGQPYGSCSSTT